MPAKKTAPKTTRTTRTAAAKAATPRAKPAAPAKVRAARAAKAAAAAAKPAARPLKRTRRKSLVGNVIADRTPKTVIVEVMRQRSHPLYGKVIRLRKRYPTHDPNEDARLGDLVRIEEGRPFSATKRFRVAEILSRAGEAGAAATEVATAASALEELEGVTAVLPTKKDDEAAQVEEGQDEERS
ncbi:MAG: 30S ribosomal protein S17 [Chloroflexi bacterium 13_1_40CM_4_68_4]|nr:MAG: 30S ribosomal protein S17 [Chloroflexi bacterium 13_1_40CM_4_68_4]